MDVIIDTNAQYSIGYQVDERVRDALNLVQEETLGPAVDSDGTRRDGGRVFAWAVTGPVLDRQRGDRLVEQGDVIGGVVRPRVTGTQHLRRAVPMSHRATPRTDGTRTPFLYVGLALFSTPLPNHNYWKPSPTTAAIQPIGNVDTLPRRTSPT